MTSTTPAALDRLSATSLVLSSPAALIAGLPYLLGFAPQDSTVLIWMRSGRIVLTQRLDASAVAAGQREWLSVVLGHHGAEIADEVIVIQVEAEPLPIDLIELLVQEAADRAVTLKDLLYVRHDRWRSLLCSDPMCCPPEGRSVDPRTACAVAAEFTVLGVAPSADRAALVAELASQIEDDGAGDRLSRVRAARPRRPRDLERWRDRAIRRISEASVPMTGVDVDFATAALADIRVRDTVLWDCAQWDHARLQSLLLVFQSVSRRAPASFVAPAATCAAVIAWLLGDGARARIALDRALSDQADYSLALLVRQAIASGMPPETWRQAMSGVTRLECRHGRT